MTINIVRGPEMEVFAEMIRYLALTEQQARTTKRDDLRVSPRRARRSRLTGAPKAGCPGCGAVGWHVEKCRMA